ncbi:MAG: succinate--CoA ligase subunit beta [Cyanobacteria bacterium P01_A01_bin.45]
MDLLEYQVKEWFGNIGIPVLPSQRIDHPTDLKRLKIQYPIVLKSQVHGGGRLKAGGVRFVGTTIDAIAAAQNIFNLPICEELPEVLLAETKYDVLKEFYLAVVLDTAVCRPILLGCQEADVDWEDSGSKIHHVVVEQDFSPFYARRLALKMGLQGTIMQSISTIVEKMYRLFVDKDLDLIEINPLAVNKSGCVMALNGSVRINERAIARHPDIGTMAQKMIDNRSTNHTEKTLGDWGGIDLPGKVAILGNGAGSVMATLDLVANSGGKPGVCLNLRHASPVETSPTNFSDRLERAISILSLDGKIEVILINFLGSIPQSGELGSIIARCIEKFHNSVTSTFPTNGRNRSSKLFPRLVIRLAGSELDSDRKNLAGLQTPGGMSIVVTESLDEAVKETVRLVNPPAVKR